MLDLLERFVVAVEKIADNMGCADTSEAEAPAPEPKKEPVKKKTTTKKKTATKKTAAKGKTVGKAKKVPDDNPSVEDVRKVLTEVQSELSRAVAKSILKEAGASTMSQLDEAKHQFVIDRAKAELAEL